MKTRSRLHLYRAHLFMVAGSVGAAWLLGLALGFPYVALTSALALHLAWHLLHLYRLQRWLADGRGQPPDSHGLWDQVYARLHKLKKQSRSRKKRLARVLKELRQATGALPDAIVVINEDHHVIWANQAAGELVGIVKSQDARRPITNILRDARVERWLSEPDDQRRDLLIESMRNPGQQILLRLFPYANGQLLLVARDVTEILLAETMRKDFVANVSHELRTPLTVIRGYVETMADEAPPQWKPVVEKVEQQTHRMRAIVDDLLTLSRLDAREAAGEDAVVRMETLISGVVDEASALSDGRHEIHTDIAPDLNLTGSLPDLHSAFLNLVSNAIRYTPIGGRVELTWAREGDQAFFAVRDNGPGIAAQHLARLTERFYRVSVDRSRDSGGTGLGLAIVKHVLALHDAQLHIDSTPGEGSEFRCVFPAARVTGHWRVDRAS